MELDLLAEKLGIELPERHYSGLAGFLLEEVRTIPRGGNEITCRHITFTVVKATPQAIQKVRLRS